jgi:hypothetical protein
MACCAKTDYSCAGMQAPDDCCRNMGHASAHQVPGTVSNQHPLPTPPAITVNVGAGMLAPIARVAPAVGLAFIRPHDPPHLHSFALLI